MRRYPSDIAFTPAVKRIQTANGSRAGYAKVERRGWRTRGTPDLAGFLAGLDMFYLGTVNAQADTSRFGVVAEGRLLTTDLPSQGV